MILDKVNPADLFPTEKQGPSVLGNMPYPVNGEVKVFEAVITNISIIKFACHIDIQYQSFIRRNISCFEHFNFAIYWIRHIP